MDLKACIKAVVPSTTYDWTLPSDCTLHYTNEQHTIVNQPVTAKISIMWTNGPATLSQHFSDGMAKNNAWAMVTSKPVAEYTTLVVMQHPYRTGFLAIMMSGRYIGDHTILHH
jgi:hypothetical protein